ncbi:MAG: FAD-dependent oxidoreductase [Cyanobacteria bacterium TGS_CYA1]|nr:FAD-dependent oxidoreductase [Cyanobacteria bacterium TGS_CYA1]
MNVKDKVIIVGGGLAGLTCATYLQKMRIPFVLLEGSDAVGGRVRTDMVNGFLLDRGFQIFLSAYPEAKEILDYDSLQLQPFYPGALIWSNGSMHKVADPFRRPIDAAAGIFNPIGSFGDKLKMASLQESVMGGNRSGVATMPDTLREETTTLSRLAQIGFSSNITQKFFKPFFSGIYLEPELQTSSLMFDFVFKMLAKGDNTLPALGMQSIPTQMAQHLPAESICFLHKVTQVEKGSVKLSSGETLTGKAVVIATEEPMCKYLLGKESKINFRSQTCLYFSAEEPPFEDPILVLDGEASGPVNNFVVPSNVASTYAPPGKALMNAVITGDPELGEDDLERSVRKQLTTWFGKQVDSWKLLRTYRIKYSLPDQTPDAKAKVDRSYMVDDQTYFCGDYVETGSINGAMMSGRKVAELIKAKMA